MPETRVFLVPDYYERFVCKADACRANCCHGWSITISMQDYFNLLSIPCSPELRRKLDTSLHLVRNPDPQRYAQILPNWEGNCPLQQEDGLCALQRECGEEILSSTCRYYPRGVRTTFDDECVMSGSCEGVLETMLAQREPIRMLRREKTFNLPLAARIKDCIEADADRQVQRGWIGILQDRKWTIGERMQRLGCAAHALHRDDSTTPIDQMETALEAFEPIEQGTASDVFALQAEMLREIAGQSESVRPFTAEAMANLGLDDREMDRMQLLQACACYEQACRHFEEVLPDWSVYYEHMLVNHILYQGYPYSARHESVWDEYLALCALYAYLRILTVGYMATRSRQSDFVDVCAAAFKLFDHSNFDHNAMVIFHRKGLDGEEAIRRLCV